MQYRADDVLLPMVPFFNTWGFFLLIIWWLTGSSLFICNYRYTGNLTRYLINHPVTVVEATISTTYSTLQLLKSRRDLLQKVKNSSLRMWYTSGAPVPKTLKEDFYQHLGQPPKADIASIRRKILKVIPTYMYPDKLICMEEFPFLPMGKIDKKQLERKT